MAHQSALATPAPAPAMTGASVLPGTPLPSWALAPAGVASPPPPADAVGEPAVEPQVEAESSADAVSDSDAVGASERELVAVGAPADDDATGTVLLGSLYPSVLPELTQDAWDEPAPPPHHGSHRFAPVDEAVAEPSSSRRRLAVLLGAVLVLAVAAFAAFVSPGFLSSSGDDEGPVPVPATHPAAAPSAAPVDYFTQWALAMDVGVTNVTKVGKLPKGTAARCGSATVDGVTGTACAFTTPGVEGTVWYPNTGLKAASQQVAAVAAATG